MWNLQGYRITRQELKIDKWMGDNRKTYTKQTNILRVNFDHLHLQDSPYRQDQKHILPYFAHVVFSETIMLLHGVMCLSIQDKTQNKQNFGWVILSKSWSFIDFSKKQMHTNHRQ